MDYSEYLIYTQLSGGVLGNTIGWLIITVLITFCYISLVKPGRIHTPRLFRYAIIVFVCALLAPLITGIFFHLMELPINPSRRGDDIQWLYMVQSNCQPFFLAISIAMLLFSIAPQVVTVAHVRPTEPKKHPLDD